MKLKIFFVTLIMCFTLSNIYAADCMDLDCTNPDYTNQTLNIQKALAGMIYSSERLYYYLEGLILAQNIPQSLMVNLKAVRYDSYDIMKDSIISNFYLNDPEINDNDLNQGLCYMSVSFSKKFQMLSSIMKTANFEDPLIVSLFGSLQKDYNFFCQSISESN